MTEWRAARTNEIKRRTDDGTNAWTTERTDRCVRSVRRPSFVVGWLPPTNERRNDRTTERPTDVGTPACRPARAARRRDRHTHARTHSFSPSVSQQWRNNEVPSVVTYVRTVGTRAGARRAGGRTEDRTRPRARLTDGIISSPIDHRWTDRASVGRTGRLGREIPSTPSYFILTRSRTRRYRRT